MSSHNDGIHKIRIRRSLLDKVLVYFIQSRDFPNYLRFQIENEDHRIDIRDLIEDDLLRLTDDRLQITAFGLLKLESPLAHRTIERCESLVPILKKSFRAAPLNDVTVDELATMGNWDSSETICALYFVSQLDVWVSLSGIPPTAIKLKIEILDIKTFREGIEEIAKKRRAYLNGAKNKNQTIGRESPEIGKEPWGRSHKLQIVTITLGTIGLLVTIYLNFFRTPAKTETVRPNPVPSETPEKEADNPNIGYAGLDDPRKGKAGEVAGMAEGSKLYAYSEVINKGRAFRDPKTQTTFGLTSIGANHQVFAMLTLPGQEATRVDNPQPGQRWEFNFRGKKYLLLLKNIEISKGKAEIELTEVK